MIHFYQSVNMKALLKSMMSFQTGGLNNSDWVFPMKDKYIIPYLVDHIEKENIVRF